MSEREKKHQKPSSTFSDTCTPLGCRHIQTCHFVLIWPKELPYALASKTLSE